jgi:hypothetical protein
LLQVKNLKTEQMALVKKEDPFQVCKPTVEQVPHEYNNGQQVNYDYHQVPVRCQYYSNSDSYNHRSTETITNTTTTTTTTTSVGPAGDALQTVADPVTGELYYSYGGVLIPVSIPIMTTTTTTTTTTNTTTTTTNSTSNYQSNSWFVMEDPVNLLPAEQMYFNPADQDMYFNVLDDHMPAF